MDLYKEHSQLHKKSQSSTDLINKSKENVLMNNPQNKNNYVVNYYNKKIFEKKIHKDKDMIFKPNLNKKSLQIASKFGPALDRLYPKKGSRISNNIQKLQNENNNDSICNSPKSNFSNFSEISSPNILKRKNSLSNNKVNSNNTKGNKSNEKEAIQHQHALYKKGLEKMIKRDEKSKEKKIIESETYKQFTYRPKINTNFTSNIKTIYKTPKNFKVNENNGNNNIENNKNIKDETLKFDLLENNLLCSPIVNHNLINNINLEEINLLDYSDNKNNNSNLNISDREKFNNIYEKNLIWKKKIANQAKRTKTSEERKIMETLTFQPQINKCEMKNDQKFIEKNLNQIEDYVNKRRANLKKQKIEEELKRKKFDFGKNFVIKPTIPKEFNLKTAKKQSSDKNTFNKSNISIINNTQSNVNSSYINNQINEKSPNRRNNNISLCDNINRSRSNSQIKGNLNHNNFDISNTNSENVNNIRNQLNIQNFFSEDNKLFIDEDENQNDLFYMNQEYSKNKHNQQFINSQQYANQDNLYINNIPNSHRNLQANKNPFTNYNSNPNINTNHLNDKENNKKIKIFNLHQNNQFNNQGNNSFYQNDLIGYNQHNNQQQLYQESPNDQLAFVNAINNLHERLVNLNI